MFVKERWEKIIASLYQNGSVRVKELAEQFQVSEDCIRKDLAALEKDGQLKRSYGGAVLEKINVHKEDVSQRINMNTPQKQKIAREALKLLQDGDMVFLDISTSNIEVAKEIIRQHKKVHVVTNMVEVMRVFQTSCEAVLTFLGGSFNRGKDGFIGSLTVEQIQNFRFDIAFLGVVGIDPYQNSVNTYVLEDGYTKKAVLSCTRKAYMLCEGSKFEQEGNYRYAGLDSFTGIILDEKPKKDLEKALKNYELNIYYEE